MKDVDVHASRYPVDVWQLTEHRFDLASNVLGETLFALANGYIGLRGAHEEQCTGPRGSSLDGTYLNGFYEIEPIHYPETAFGLASRNQFMLNVPNAKRVDLFLQDERFDLLGGTILNYHRTLDFRTGLLTRTVIWQSSHGQQVEVLSRRMSCLTNRHLFALQYRVRPLNFSGSLRLVCTLDGAVKNMEAGEDPRVGSASSGQLLQLVDAAVGDCYAAFMHRTLHSGFVLSAATATTFEALGVQPHRHEAAALPDRLEQRYHLEVERDQTVSLVKYGAYLSSRDYPAEELPTRTREILRSAQDAGFEALCAGQADFLADFWRHADIEIDGDSALQQGIRFNLFHLLQSVGRDGKTNISAKGLTGEGYEGHYFWDSEIYIFPFFLFTAPDIARCLLHYRYSGLDQARARARELAHARGALYPWRTIGGEECSAYFPAGTAQYHFQADIAYTIKLYAEVTGDESYVAEAGAEIVMETARIWMGIGNYCNQRGGSFCLNEVTGPDEYTALVDNNYYTNAMARLHLRYAAELSDLLRGRYPDDFRRVRAAMALDDDEPEQWRRAAERMYLPYNAEIGVHPQDDTFLAKKVWDFKGTPSDHYPLLLHYHPLVIYRHQVCKQADVVLALVLLGNTFTIEEKRRDFDYYEAITTHDSSLSSCIFGIVAAEIGYGQKAYDYFMHTARTDLDNTQGNSEFGVHTAAMGGTWLGVAYGFAGMRVYDGMLQFTPTVPEGWTRYAFAVRFRAQVLRVEVRCDGVRYCLLEGLKLTFLHRGQTYHLTREQPDLAMP